MPLDASPLEREATRTRTSYTVEKVEQVSPSIVALDLLPPAGSHVPHWEPGANVAIKLPSGLVRQYSLCGDLADTSRLRIAVQRAEAGAGGSEEVHRLSAGATIELSSPVNQFPLVHAERYLLIAGGIGLTPLIAMAEQLERAGATYDVHYAVRSAADAGLAGWLPDGARLTVHSSGSGRRLDIPSLIADARPGTAIYACGPARMHDELASWAFRLHSRGCSLHTERFSTGGEPAGAGFSEADAAIRVTFARSQKTATVQPGETILNHARALGCAVESSCEEGHCGTCETAVLEGEADHRDEFLTEDERASGNTMMICISRAVGSSLVLDL